jgi:hypothetical protein
LVIVSSRDDERVADKFGGLFILPGRSKSQSQLPRRAGVSINEVLDMLGHGLACNVAPRLYFLSDIFGNVISPMLQRVE